MAGLLKLFIAYPQYLLFGVLLTCFSGFGQTFFIALFGGVIRETFKLSHGEFGLLYSSATVLSAMSLVWVGKHIDTLSLRLYTLIVCLMMVFAAFALATAQSVWLVLLGIFLMRLTGQGLFGHIASTTMARQFESQRGRAVSISSLGHPVGEAILPITAVTLIHSIGWRETWLGIAGFVLIILLPMLLWLSQAQKAISMNPVGASLEENGTSLRQWSQKEVLKDKRFFLILPAMLTPALILTGIFFHQVHVVEAKGWDLQWFAASFIWFSSATILSSMTTGILTDKYGSLKIVPFFLIPLGLGLFALMNMHHPVAVALFMVGAGLSMGATPIITIATWAEVYGVSHIGGIRSLTSSLMVLSTAITPVAIGWLIDRQVSFSQIALFLLLYLLLASVMAIAASFAYQKSLSAKVEELSHEAA